MLGIWTIRMKLHRDWSNVQIMTICVMIIIVQYKTGMYKMNWLLWDVWWQGRAADSGGNPIVRIFWERLGKHVWARWTTRGLRGWYEPKMLHSNTSTERPSVSATINMMAERAAAHRTLMMPSNSFFWKRQTLSFQKWMVCGRITIP